MNESFLTISDETDIPFHEVIIGYQPGSTELQLAFLNEAAAPFALHFVTPASAAEAAVLLASAKENGEDASLADLRGIAQDEELAAA